MAKCLVPSYLSDLVPDLKSNLNNYNLRNSNNVRTVACRTNLYKILFPIRCGRVELSPSRYKKFGFLVTYLDINRPYPNKLFCIGQRRLQILHTRLRNDCCSLKHHLYLRNDSPNFVCGAIETNAHYFFECPLYVTIRNKIIRSISYYEKKPIDLQTLLSGNCVLTFQENEEVFFKVQLFTV